MKINGKDVKIEDLVEDVNIDKNIIMKRENGLPLRATHIETLERYHIDYKCHTTLESLIFEIEEIINESDDCEDLIILSEELSEINYYYYTNK